MSEKNCQNGTSLGRLPQGRRGLKFIRAVIWAASTSSPPAREAWIEIVVGSVPFGGAYSRLPQGRRGLKSS